MNIIAGWGEQRVSKPREGNESTASEVGEAGTQIPLLEMTPALLLLILDAFF